MKFYKMIFVWLLQYILYNINVYILVYTIMDEKNTLTYDAWKEYLKNDREINVKWKSLIELWENVKKDLKENLNSLPYSEALRRRKFLTAKNIFNVINTAKEKPNFAWDRKLIYNEEDERDEYVIQCKNPSSDYIFRRIKEERGVTNMHGESIDKYLKPIAEKIWALKAALKVSVQTETKPSDLSYEAMKTEVKKDEWAENHYWWDDENIMNDDGDIVLNPKYEHIPNKEKVQEEDDVEDKTKTGDKKVEKEKKSDPRQLEIPFDYED